MEVKFLGEMSRKKKTQAMTLLGLLDLTTLPDVSRFITFSFPNLLVFEENFPGVVMVPPSLPEAMASLPRSEYHFFWMFHCLSQPISFRL